MRATSKLTFPEGCVVVKAYAHACLFRVFFLLFESEFFSCHDFLQNKIVNFIIIGIARSRYLSEHRKVIALLV